MSCCGKREASGAAPAEADPAHPPQVSEESAQPGSSALAEGLGWFAEMVPHCYEAAQAAKAAGTPIVGIMCEYTPRELVLAAGGLWIAAFLLYTAGLWQVWVQPRAPRAPVGRPPK